jgi:hypothetical protein
MMQHDMERMEHIVSATFEGHALPGSIFILWALFWIGGGLLRGGAIGSGGGALESGIFMPIVKLAGATLGIVTEIPGDGWYPMDVAMSWQHVTMYSVFGVSGLVDLAARRGLLSNQATFVAYGLAMANAGMLFWGHSAHGGVEGLVHAILALVFSTVGALAFFEIVRPSEGLAWGRAGAQVLLGTWFIVGAWIIYLSGWDLSDMVRESWTYMVFSWTATLVVALAVSARIVAKARTAKAA